MGTNYFGKPVRGFPQRVESAVVVAVQLDYISAVIACVGKFPDEPHKIKAAFAHRQAVLLVAAVADVTVNDTVTEGSYIVEGAFPAAPHLL